MLHALALWGWHLPWLFNAALRDNGWHTAQHASFLGSALLFWWALIQPRARGAQGAALVYLFTTMLHTGALGALLTCRRGSGTSPMGRPRAPGVSVRWKTSSSAGW